MNGARFERSVKHPVNASEAEVRRFLAEVGRRAGNPEPVRSGPGDTFPPTE